LVIYSGSGLCFGLFDAQNQKERETEVSCKLREHAGSLAVRKTCIITGFLSSACREAMYDSGHKINNANKLSFSCTNTYSLLLY